MTSLPPEAPADDARATDIVRQWAAVYDMVYEPPADAPTDPGPDYSGWRSSITGENYPADAMREWVRGTVDGITALGGQRVLELGAGSGLLVRELIDSVQEFVGTDISPVAVRRLQERYLGRPNVRFLVADAAQRTGITGFDVAVVNSVVQHFPDLAYLDRAVRSAVAAVAAAPAGTVYFGDIRNLALHQAFRLAVLAGRQPGPTPAGQLLDTVAADLDREQELLVDVEYFARVADDLGLAADVRLKPGRAATEMNLFRYDVRLRPRTDRLVDPDAVARVPWQPDALDSLAGADGRDPAAPVVLAGVPHPDLIELIRTLDGLRQAAPTDEVDLAALLAPTGAGQFPHEVAEWAAARGLSCFCTPARSQPGCFDAVLAGPMVLGLDVRPRSGVWPLGTDPLRANERMLAAIVTELAS